MLGFSLKNYRRINFHLILNIVLAITNLLFIGYILIIGYYNPIRVDDFCFLQIVKEYDVFSSLQYWYNNWQGRFMPQLFNNVIVLLYDNIGSTLPLTLFHLFLFTFSILRIKNAIEISKNRRLPYEKIFFLNITFLLFAQVFISLFEPSTFFWVNVSTMYFGGMCFFLFGLSTIIKKSENWFSYFLICFSFLYVGSSSEHIGIIASTILLVILVVTIVRNGIVTTLENARNRKLLLATITCLIAFLIMFLAPGNNIRRSFFPEINFFESIPISVKSFIRLIFLIEAKLYYFLFLSLLFVWLGTFYRKKIQEIRFIIYLLISITLLIIFLFIMMIPTAYAISGLGPLRSLTYISFVLCFFSIITAFSFGYYTSISKRIAFLLASIGVSFFLFTTVKKIYYELPDTISYAKAERNRIDFLILQKEGYVNNILSLDPIQVGKNNILWYFPLSSDPENWQNGCLCEALDLSFKIKEDPITESNKE